jgi:hypothetical protein
MRWRGRWLMGVAAIHTLFALVVFREPLLQLVSRGLFDAVGQDPLLGGVTWFVFFGAALAMAGQAVDAAEQQGHVPRSLGVTVLAMTGLGVVLMPASGLWLLVPPGVSLLRDRTSA